jgi:hypothetical protein
MTMDEAERILLRPKDHTIDEVIVATAMMITKPIYEVKNVPQNN